MEEAAIPGFRSLTQAGIQLREGEGVASAPPVEELNQEPHPQGAQPSPSSAPLAAAPQAAESNPTPVDGGGSAERRTRGVALQPREPGTKRPLPRDAQGQSQAPVAHAVPAGVYVGQMPGLQFSCPCCGVVLTISDPSAYNGQPGPCPGCSAVVMPPQLVSPFALAGRPEVVRQAPAQSAGTAQRHYSGFVV